MPVLIDGNNLLHAAIETEPERPPGRTQLCGVLTAWARRTGESVHIVFDGPEPPRPRAEQISGSEIRVSYSGSGVPADDVLVHLVETDSAARRILLVSSDREIVRVAKRRRAQTMRSADFWREVQRMLARPVPPALEPPVKREGLAPGESRDWLEAFGLSDDDADEMNPMI